ncbi:MAG: hypothetical protein K8S23_11950 [Candidatus Cloacimonetes bacterium]|nr:hypothetical protein [Candidatus Cloacimonadota bacterium]
MSLLKNHNVSPLTSVFQKSIFIWIDILGFSDALEDETSYKELSENLEIFQSHFNTCEEFDTRLISDGLVLYIINPRPSNFKKILSIVGKKQIEFILETNQFIRGGIAIGTKYESQNDNSQNIFISNGLARAVKIESQIVNWPIIGTDSKNLTEIKNNFNISEDDFNLNICRCLNKRGEDVYFIDFLNHLEDKHKYYSLLSSKIEEFSKKPVVRDKYIWLLKYLKHRFEKTNTPDSIEGIVL